ncbi:MAG: YggS family pyridoxal phosphate-dependent enzyme, partial [Aristaeellaceae bacterium]
MMDKESELAARLAVIRDNLAKASEGRYPVPKLIAVTKTHPAEDILPLKALGITDIGENRVQELEEKLPALERNFDIHL